jgi:hypothetical protein
MRSLSTVKKAMGVSNVPALKKKAVVLKRVSQTRPAKAGKYLLFLFMVTASFG